MNSSYPSKGYVFHRLRRVTARADPASGKKSLTAASATRGMQPRSFRIEIVLDENTGFYWDIDWLRRLHKQVLLRRDRR